MEACAPRRVTENGRSRAGELRGHPRVLAFEQGYSECTVEAIARGNGVDGFDRVGLHPSGFTFGGCDVGALCAALERHAPEAPGRGGASPRFSVSELSSRKKAASDSLGGEPCEPLPDGLAERRRGRRVEHDGYTEFRATGEGVIDGRQGQLELAQDHAGVADYIDMPVDVSGIDFAVGAGDDNDGVLSVFSEEDGERGRRSRARAS